MAMSDRGPGVGPAGGSDAVLPGWHADPTGDWMVRYWDGAGWTDHVANGVFQTLDPVSMESPPEVEANLWAMGRNFLTTHRIWIDDDYSNNGPASEFKLWMLEPSEVTAAGGRDRLAADINVTIRYPGYVGRSRWVLRAVPNPHEVAAQIRKWANRNRRAFLPQ